MFKRILVPLDGSSLAEQALPVAAQLARVSQGTLLLTRVVPPPVDYGGPAAASLLTAQVIDTELETATAYLKTIARSSVLSGIDTIYEATFGSPASQILFAIEAQGADIVVICSHGRTGFTRWALGSVARQLVHQSTVPVLVLRDGRKLLAPDSASSLRILVPLDGSPLAEKALTPAVNLATALVGSTKSTLHLAQIVKQITPPLHEEGFVGQLNAESVEFARVYLLRVSRELQEKNPGSKVTWSVARDSDVAAVLLNIAEHGCLSEEDDSLGGSDLIAISTHGRGGLERWIMGSVTERLLNATKLPILVVRPAKKA